MGPSVINAVQLHLKIKFLAFSLTLRAHTSNLCQNCALRVLFNRISNPDGFVTVLGGPINCLEKTNFWISPAGLETSRGHLCAKQWTTATDHLFGRERTACEGRTLHGTVRLGQPASFGMESGFLRSSLESLLRARIEY